MRIAVSGAHRTGKTTLIEELVGSLPTFVTVDEPYYLLEEEGPDRVSVSGSDQERLRRRVDDELQDIVLDDRWSFGVPAIEVVGAPGERARQVLAYLGRGVRTSSRSRPP